MVPKRVQNLPFFSVRPETSISCLLGCSHELLQVRLHSLPTQMETAVRHSLGRRNTTEEWFCGFYPRSINTVYSDQIYLLWGKKKKKVFANTKCLLLLKMTSVWLSGSSLDTSQFPSFVEQLLLMATAQSAKPHEGFAEVCL